MAIRGKPFQKGNKANPLGGGAHNPALRAARKMTREELADIGGLLLNSSVEEIKAIIADPTTSITRRILLRQMIRADKGSLAAANWIFERLVGKVQDDVKITAGVDIKVSSDQLASMAQAALKRTKGGNE